MSSRALMRRVVVCALTCGLLVLILVPGAFAWTDTYYANTGTYCVQPGQAAVSDWHGSVGINYVGDWSVCDQAYNPQMGTTYMRPDYTLYPYVWANSGGPLVDLRTISYGRSICKANSGNGTGIIDFYCLTGS